MRSKYIRRGPNIFCVVIIFGLACLVVMLFSPVETRENTKEEVDYLPRSAAFLRMPTSKDELAPVLLAAKRSQALDEEPIHIVQSFCIDNSIGKQDTGLTTLRSILAARAAGPSRNRRYVFHILADEWAAWLISYNSTAKLPGGKALKQESLGLFHEQWGDVLAYIDASGGRLKLLVHPEEDVYAATDAAMGAGSTTGLNHDGFKRCSPLRLQAPFIHGLNTSRAIFLDLDMIVLCDLEQMWDLFDTWTDDQWFGISPEAPHDAQIGATKPQHAMPCAPQYGFSGVNNGAFMMRLDRVRAHLKEYWSEVMRIINERGYRAPRFATDFKFNENVMNHPDGMLYYDQDIMTIMSFDWPARFYALDRSYNFRWRPFRGHEWGSMPGICIEHFSARDYGDDSERAGLFRYWRDYRRVATAKAPRSVRTSGAPNTRWHFAYGTGKSVGPRVAVT